MNFHLKSIGFSFLLAFTYILIKDISAATIIAFMSDKFFLYLIFHAAFFYVTIITGRFIYHHANIQTSVYLAEQKRKQEELRRYYNDM